jgi:hypothetical protein
VARRNHWKWLALHQHHPGFHDSHHPTSSVLAECIIVYGLFCILLIVPDLISFPSKKQKTAGAFQEQSIDQLNDVTAVSGVNLRV